MDDYIESGSLKKAFRPGKVWEAARSCSYAWKVFIARSEEQTCTPPVSVYEE